MTISALVLALVISVPAPAQSQALPPLPPRAELPGAPPGFNPVWEKADALHDQERFAEEADLYSSVIKAHPQFVFARYMRLRAQISGGEHPSDNNLAAARAGGFATPADSHLAATFLVDIVLKNKTMPAPDAQLVLREAVARLDDALKGGDTMDSLVYKSIALRQLAGYETDPAAAKKLTDEADALRARGMALRKQ